MLHSHQMVVSNETFIRYSDTLLLTKIYLSLHTDPFLKKIERAC